MRTLAYRYFDDGTPTSVRPRAKDRDYAILKDQTNTISLVEWAKFLELWSIQDLNAAARLLRVSSFHDLAKDERDLLCTLRRRYSHLLFLKADDPLQKYQCKLQKLHDLGILNLHLTSVVHDERSQWQVCMYANIVHSYVAHTCVACMQAEKRSLVSRVREAGKKVKRAKVVTQKVSHQLQEEIKKRKETEKLLRHANKQLAAFKVSHPEWRPPEGVSLLPTDQDDATHIFKVLQ